MGTPCRGRGWGRSWHRVSPSSQYPSSLFLRWEPVHLCSALGGFYAPVIAVLLSREILVVVCNAWTDLVCYVLRTRIETERGLETSYRFQLLRACCEDGRSDCFSSFVAKEHIVCFVFVLLLCRSAILLKRRSKIINSTDLSCFVGFLCSRGIFRFPSNGNSEYFALKFFVDNCMCWFAFNVLLFYRLLCVVCCHFLSSAIFCFGRPSCVLTFALRSPWD